MGTAHHFREHWKSASVDGAQPTIHGNALQTLSGSVGLSAFMTPPKAGAFDFAETADNDKESSNHTSPQNFFKQFILPG